MERSDRYRKQRNKISRINSNSIIVKIINIQNMKIRFLTNPFIEVEHFSHDNRVLYELFVLRKDLLEMTFPHELLNLFGGLMLSTLWIGSSEKLICFCHNYLTFSQKTSSCFNLCLKMSNAFQLFNKFKIMFLITVKMSKLSKLT